MTTEKPKEEVVAEEASAATTSTKKKKAPKMIIQDDHVYGDVLHVIKFTSNEKPDEEFTVAATSPSSAARLVGINLTSSLRNVSVEDYNPE